MGIDAKAGFAGLVTATSEAAGAATGLRVADNVVLRKEGALMPRPVYASSALSRTYRAAFPYKGALTYLDGNNILYNAAQTAIAHNAVDQPRYGVSYPALRSDVQSAKESRGNFYFATSRGVFKLTGASSEIYAAGINVLATVQSIGSISSGTTLLAAGQKVAYRVVQTTTDVNGVVVRGRPSGAYAFDSGALACSPQVVISSRYFTDRATTVELYRTRIFPNTAAVDDEYQLIATFVPPTNNSPNISYLDRIPDASRGTTLYTSPSRGGAENANDRPPGCACLERFRGSLFFGNTRGPGRIVISYKYSGDVTGSATGIGRRTGTASWTNGSSTVTVNSTVGLQPGMLLRANTAPVYSAAVVPTIQTVVNSTTLTIVGPADNTRSGAAVTFDDVIQWFDPVSNQWAFAYTPSPRGDSFGGLSLSYYIFSYQGLNSYDVSPPQPGYDYTTVIESTGRGASTFALRATHGDEFYPALPLANATGLSATYDDLPHGLAWSEPDEPEHVPPKNFARVGDAGKGILALVATKDRLLIFKEDGLFMLTGDTAKNFAIYPLDTTCLCILPGSVRRLKNTVFLLTNLGLCAVDENGGVTVVSRPIQLEVASIVNAIRAAQKSSGLYNMPGLVGHTGSSDDAQGEYHLALGSSTPSFGGQVLVYSLPRDGFTTFTFTTAPVALATDGEGNPLVLTSSALLTPTTTLGTIAARVSPRAFADPALLGKFWTHVLAGFSQLTGTTNVQAKFTSSASMVAGASITETFDLPVDSGTSLLQFPLGSLLRHPVPAAVRRAYMLFVELLINVSSGSFTLETIAAESRENISNKEPTHGSGST